MESKERWFPITSSDDYHFPGVFSSPFPQRMGYCEDISVLPNFEPTDEHFLFSDIQLGKGKARPVRSVEVTVDGKKELLKYRIIPCGGVKVCGATDVKCDYVVSTRETRPCPNHPRHKLIRQGERVEIILCVQCGQYLIHNRKLSGGVCLPVARR